MGSATVFRNGRIWQDGAPRDADLAVADGRIVAIGPDLDAPPGAAVVDLGGGLLLPAFGEGHAHPIFGGLELQGPAVRAQTTVAGIVAEVGRWARANPDAEWVLGASYDPSLSAGGAVRRGLARRGGPGPAGAAAVGGLPHGVVQQRGAASRRRSPRRPPTRGSATSTATRTGARAARCGSGTRATCCSRPHPSTTSRGTRALADACRIMNAVGITWMQDAWVDDGDEERVPRARRGRRTDRTQQSRVPRRPRRLARLSSRTSRCGASGSRRAAPTC